MNRSSKVSHGKRYMNRKAAGLCVTCGKKNDRQSMVDCSTCSEVRKQRCRDRYRRCLDSGLCQRCGELNDRRESGKIDCLDCSLQRSILYHRRKSGNDSQTATETVRDAGVGEDQAVW